MISYTVEAECYNGGFVGNAIAKKVTAEIFNDGEVIHDLENKEIEVFAGIDLESGPENVTFGKYIVSEIENDELLKKIKITAYDYMIKFNVDYNDTNVYPITAKEYLQNLCAYCGVELGTTSFVNDDFVINSTLFDTTTTCKAVLIEICKLMGGFATIGRDNKLYLKNLDSSEASLKVIEVNNLTVSELDQTKIKNLIGTTGSVIVEAIDGNTYDTYSSQKEYGPINFFAYKSVQSNIEDVTKENTETVNEKVTKLTVDSSALIQTQEDMESVTQELWVKIFKDFKYKPFNIKYYGFPYLDIGDRISIYDLEDNEYSSFIFNHSFTFNGNFSGEIVTEALTETQQEYNSYGSLSSALKQLKSSTLESAKQTATQLITEFNGGYVIKKGGELFIADNQDLDKAVRVWRWNINGLGYSKSGIAGPYGLAMTMDGQIVADFITTGTMSADRILGGTFRVGGEEYGNGTIEVLDADGNTVILLNKDGITLTDGTKLIGNQGVLSNLQYSFSSTHPFGKIGNFEEVGFFCVMESVNYKSALIADVYIPENFVITEAKIVLNHAPIYYDDIDAYGYARALKVYKAEEESNFYKYVASIQGTDVTGVTETLEYTEISNALGVSSYTPSTPSSTNHRLETIIGNDIKDYLKNGINKIKIESSNAVPTTKTQQECAKRTGFCNATINILGYIN